MKKKKKNPSQKEGKNKAQVILATKTENHMTYKLRL
jgi:hypothetical protein